jgi:hypothetical protein
MQIRILAGFASAFVCSAVEEVVGAMWCSGRKYVETSWQPLMQRGALSFLW